MLARSMDADSNIDLVRQVLDDMRLIVSLKPQPALPFGVGVTFLEFGEPQWSCGIFTMEGSASLRFFANIAKQTRASHARILEAVNYANFHFLLDFTMDFDSERGWVRLRAATSWPGPNLSPKEVRQEIDLTLAICQHWTEVMTDVLASNRPIAEAFETSRTEAKRKMRIPLEQNPPNL